MPMKEVNELESMPFNEEAENSILGSILIDGEKSFNKIQPWIRSNKAFYSLNNKYIWNLILKN